MIAQRRSLSLCLMLALCLVDFMPAAASAQQIFGVWRTQIPGITFPMVITVMLGANGRFQQNINGGPSVCLQSMTVGAYGPLGRGLYRFVVRDYEPKRDCTGHFIRSMPGWTAALRLVSPRVLIWRDQLSGRVLQFVRIR